MGIIGKHETLDVDATNPNIARPWVMDNNIVVKLLHRVFSIYMQWDVERNTKTTLGNALLLRALVQPAPTKRGILKDIVRSLRKGFLEAQGNVGRSRGEW